MSEPLRLEAIETESTSGPWTFSPTFWPTDWAGWDVHSKQPNRIRIQPKDGATIIAYVEHHGTGDGQDVNPTDEDYANARLLAAAPDLLEACTAVLDAMKIPGPALPLGVAVCLDKAIAKAGVPKEKGTNGSP